MSSLNAKLLAGRRVNFNGADSQSSQTGPSPKAAPKAFSPEAPSSSTTAPPKATSAATPQPRAENYTGEPSARTPWNESYDKLPARPSVAKERTSGKQLVDEMRRINALNVEPSPSTPQLPKAAGPPPSVPGTLREENSAQDDDQRGKKGFKGDDSNTQSSANKEFTHRYYQVVPEHFLQALDFECCRPGNFKHEPIHVMGDMIVFKHHGAEEYFPHWASPFMVNCGGEELFVRPTAEVIASLQAVVSFWGSCIALHHTVVFMCSPDSLAMFSTADWIKEWSKLRYMRDRIPHMSTSQICWSLKPDLQWEKLMYFHAFSA
eukprot:13432527-Alexandrium_andersonii.AAC.1